MIVPPTPLLQQSLIDLKFKGSSPATTINRQKFQEVTCHKFEILHKNKFFRRPNNHLVCDYSSISYRHLLLVKYKVPLTYLNTLASFIRYSLRGDHEPVQQMQIVNVSGISYIIEEIPLKCKTRATYNHLLQKQC